MRRRSETNRARRAGIAHGRHVSYLGMISWRSSCPYRRPDLREVWLRGVIRGAVEGQTARAMALHQAVARMGLALEPVAAALRKAFAALTQALPAPTVTP